MCCRVYSELRIHSFQQRKDFVPVLATLPIFEKFIFLMDAHDPEVLTSLINFVNKCSDVRKSMFI